MCNIKVITSSDSSSSQFYKVFTVFWLVVLILQPTATHFLVLSYCIDQCRVQRQHQPVFNRKSLKTHCTIAPRQS